MLTNNFRIRILLRVLLLVLTILVLSFLYFKDVSLLAVILLLLLLVYQVYALIRDAEAVVKIMTRFFDSIRYSDFTRTITSKGLGQAFDELNKSYNEVMSEFIKARKEKEENYRYMQTIVQHIGIGLISFFPDGEVNLINNAAKKLFKINNLRNVKALESINKKLVDELLSIKAGKKSLIKFVHNNDFYQLMLFATEFKMNEKIYKFVSIQNIMSELEEKEMEAWQKLISVLTHEIMNSITPISSISQTLNGLINQKELTADNLEDVKVGMETIHRRSEGLIEFVNNYRSISKIPVANFSIAQVKDLFANISMLMEKQIKEKGIEFKVSVEPQTLELTLDQKLIEQVLINLLLNAIDAVKDKANPVIEMNADMGERGCPVINIKDNGVGILEDVQEKIFIPFFTTKSNGSGIGLSLAKQIMKQHSGNIRFVSNPDEGTTFTLYFNM
jgi:nitrogen fixation/metabolism regulation signal transduction histidine kinase